MWPRALNWAELINININPRKAANRLREQTILNTWHTILWSTVIQNWRTEWCYPYVAQLLVTCMGKNSNHITLNVENMQFVYQKSISTACTLTCGGCLKLPLSRLPAVVDKTLHNSRLRSLIQCSVSSMEWKEKMARPTRTLHLLNFIVQQQPW